MVKPKSKSVPCGTKLIVGTNSITIILTDKDIGDFRQGRISLQIGNDMKGNLSLEKAERVVMATVTSGDDKSLASPVPAKVADAKSTIESPPVLSSTQVEDGNQKLPSKKKPPVKEKSFSKKNPVKLDPNIAIAVRLKRIGLMDDDTSFDCAMEGLDSDVKKAISLQSYLWKEYAIANRLNGYESSFANRADAIRKDDKHLPSNHLKINAHLNSNVDAGVASGNAGKCLQPGSEESQIREELETSEEEKMQAYEVSKIQRTDQETYQERSEEASHASEGSTVSNEITARSPQKWSTVASHANETRSEPFAAPCGEQRFIPVEHKRGKSRGREGRKSSGRGNRS